MQSNFTWNCALTVEMEEGKPEKVKFSFPKRKVPVVNKEDLLDNKVLRAMLTGDLRKEQRK